MPEVSIIIPAYNSAAFIGEALQSVLNQDFNDYEVIVVDDGSTDETAEVVAKFSDHRILYIYQSNEGSASARNHGLRLARGDLIAFLDADDIWRPGYLSYMVEYLHTHSEADGVYCGYRYMKADGTPLPEIVNRVVPPEQLYNTLLEGNFLSTCTLVVRQSCFNNVGYFDVNLRQAMDYDMWLRLSRTYLLVGSPEVLVWYRRHCSNTTVNVRLQNRSLEYILQKHFGDEDSPPGEWSTEKRLAYAGYYRLRAGNLLRAGDVEGCARSIGRMLLIRPDWVNQDKWYFMLASAVVPRDRIGEIQALDLHTSARTALTVLNHLFALSEFDHLLSDRAQAFGTMYWTLATIAYWQRELSLSREWYMQAFREYPRILFDKRRGYLMARYGIAGIMRQWQMTISEGAHDRE